MSPSSFPPEMTRKRTRRTQRYWEGCRHLGGREGGMSFMLHKEDSEEDAGVLGGLPAPGRKGEGGREGGIG